MAQALQLGSPTKITLNATSCWHDLARVEGYEEGMKSKLSKTPKVCGFKWFILKLCPKFLKILKRVSASRAKTEETSNYVKVSMKCGRKDIMRSKMQNSLVQKNAWNVPQNRWKGYLGYLDTFRTFVRDSPRSFQSLEGLIYTLCLYYYIYVQLMSTTWKQTRVKWTLQYPRAQIFAAMAVSFHEEVHGEDSC